MSDDERMFRDWTRVSDRPRKSWGGRTGVIVWDPLAGEYKVLWDDNGWEDYSPSEAKRELKEI